ncbi:OsmC family peroxiredoxin [Pontibacter oryzae]|uniref:OsmC family peroxiredoxin n=1 Tax=Pontibacter oryzae TaxID=2304593 RepID=UPI0011C3F9CD|nr:OsmC family peroxiredoxin [Pontibacter oryzae]
MKTKPNNKMQHTAQAHWEKGLTTGQGNVKTGNGTVDSGYSYSTRFEGRKNGTSPEELMAAALVGCYSMFLSMLLGQHNFVPDYIDAGSKVYLGQKDGNPFVEKIEMKIDACVPGITEQQFLELAEKAKKNCPISVALSGVPVIGLEATLVE